LDLPSCNNPRQASRWVTTSSVGKQFGRATFTVVPGDPNTAADEADIGITATATDVRFRSDNSDFTGYLLLRAQLRITDQANDPADAPATVRDNFFYVPVGCNPTPSNPNAGSTCDISTTADTLVPGFAKEGKRTVISAPSVTLLDAGDDSKITPAGKTCPPICGTGDERAYLEEGVFTP
jgi:hypothetical protein